MATVKTKVRTFKGNWAVFIILLCFGIIPALIYYWIKCEEVETTSKK
ncbi:MAG TPA: hypothetical protein VI968_00625 [archaeon]|nr:hypothetical protein [archaeon]